MKNIWTYISTLLAGIIAGLLIFLKLDGPETVINDNQQIGKMKQRGRGNDATVTVEKGQSVTADASDTPSAKEIRHENRDKRKINRVARRRERKDKSESG